VRLEKRTSDRFFKIIVESDELNDDMDDNEEIPATSVEQLILELELLAAELRKFLAIDDKASVPN
jgi:hypothetical protein